MLILRTISGNPQWKTGIRRAVTSLLHHQWWAGWRMLTSAWIYLGWQVTITWAIRPGMDLAGILDRTNGRSSAGLWRRTLTDRQVRRAKSCRKEGESKGEEMVILVVLRSPFVWWAWDLVMCCYDESKSNQSCAVSRLLRPSLWFVKAQYMLYSVVVDLSKLQLVQVQMAWDGSRTWDCVLRVFSILETTIFMSTVRQSPTLAMKEPIPFLECSSCKYSRVPLWESLWNTGRQAWGRRVVAKWIEPPQPYLILAKSFIKMQSIYFGKKP